MCLTELKSAASLNYIQLTAQGIYHLRHREVFALDRTCQTHDRHSRIDSDSTEQYFDIVMDAATVGDMLSAKRQLAQLYRLGEGVERNSAEAVRWYSLAAVQAINELTMHPSENRAEAAFSILLELGELHREIGDLQRAIDTFLRMEAVISSLPNELSSASTDRWRLICFNRLGSLFDQTARPNTAYGYYEQTLSITERLYENNKTECAYDELAAACYHVGFIDYLFRGEVKLLKRACAIWTELYEQTDSGEFFRRKSSIELLFAATGSDTVPEQDRLTVPEPAADRAAADALAAELNEYIRENGSGNGTQLAEIIPWLDALLVTGCAALCIWGYFAGVFHSIFAFLREIF